MLLISLASAATIVVDPGGGGDATTIQGGLALAGTGDTVEVAPGTYNENLDFQARSVMVEGRGGSSVTFLVGTGVGPVVRMDSGEGAGTGLRGFTISGGNAEDFEETSNRGGGLYALGVPVVLDDIVFQDNVAEFGGGAFLGESTAMQVLGVVFSGNEARAGGGLYVYAGAATVNDSSFDGNQADLGSTNGGGGGLASYNAEVDVTSTAFTGNTATGSGGQVYAGFGGGVTCTFCTQADGSAPDGAGIYVYQAYLTLTSSTVSNHVASNVGGGVYARAGSVVMLSTTELYGNDATYGGGLLLADSSAECRFLTVANNTAEGGGGVYLDGADLRAINSTWSGNVALTSNGGGLALDGSTAVVSASIFAVNEGYSGGSIHVNGTSSATLSNLTIVEGASSNSAGGIRVSDGGEMTVTSSIIAYGPDGSAISAGSSGSVTLSYLDLFTNAGGNVSGGLSDPVGINGSISENPQFESFAQDGLYLDDLRLAAGSPCIDAGDPAVTDADGTRTDIGAFGGPDGLGWAELDWDVDGYTEAAGDCDDGDPAVHPGAADECDTIDQDCDGVARENCDTGTPTGDDTGTPTDTDTATTDTETGTTGTDDTGPAADDTGADAKDGDGCGCAGAPGAGWLAVVVGALATRRRSSRARWHHFV